jgi:uncharacterized membrane protein YsdA (DUF1294 family)
VGLFAMAVDKASTKIGSDRISGRDLALIALAGWFTGMFVGGVTIRHKTSKPGFWAPVAVATVIWGLVLALYFFPRLLTL